MTDQAAAVVAIVRDVLGKDVLGAYLHGSAVLGGLRPTSDCDVLVVVRRPTSAEERSAIVRGLFEISGERARRGPARPVELTVVVQSDVRPWRYPPRLDLQYGEWLRSEMEAGVIADPHPAPDLALLVTMVLAGGRALLGPPPTELLDPVPPDDLRRAAVAGVPGLLADLATDTRNVLLTLARIWVTLATGAIVPKDAAADWALQRLAADVRPALADARDSYHEGHHGVWDGRLPETRATAVSMVAAIDRLAPRDGPAPRGGQAPRDE
jgi:streptomycin 3"-adenylyltransferase